MITIENKEIANIKSLIIEADKNKGKPLPTVIFYHGFQSAKENNLTLAFLLAKENYRIILPDALYHGERSENLTSDELSLAFWEIISANITELEEIKKELYNKSLILDNRIGVSGTSMGGVTSASLIKQYDWIKTGAILMGSPNLVDFGEELITEYNKTSKNEISVSEKEKVLNELKPFDLSKDIKAVNNRPLLFWHGVKDNVVPIEHSEKFVAKLKESSYTSEVKMLKEAERGHHLSRYSILETVKWFVKHL
ncbi:MAG TPA: prolyl oligopeptidase family serine peptidase [Pseudogracilibacillus sp.]|nr:prolyl oligopeptidase family serine peptidase [Pseudogracilibacillus sp.]